MKDIDYTKYKKLYPNETERVDYIIKYWSHVQIVREYEKLEQQIEELKQYLKEIIDIEDIEVKYEQDIVYSERQYAEKNFSKEILQKIESWDKNDK